MFQRTATLRLAPCLLAAAAYLLLDARPASASCGDYVHFGIEVRPNAPDKPSPADSPCAGGRCERAPPAPPIKPTAPTGGGMQDALLHLTTAAVAPPGFGFVDPPTGTRFHIPSVPFHPPRA